MSQKNVSCLLAVLSMHTTVTTQNWIDLIVTTSDNDQFCQWQSFSCDNV